MLYRPGPRGYTGSMRLVTIHTLVRRRDDVVVALHELGHPNVCSTLAGRSGATQFAVLAHWAGAATPLRCDRGAAGALLADASGASVRLRPSVAPDT